MATHSLHYNSDTLVIHPWDPTTACLKIIYEGRGWDVIDWRLKRGVYTTEMVTAAIEHHSRILFLGHGTPYGLLCGDEKTRFARYMINSHSGPLLQTKETFSIWCDSDRYFSTFKIPGLHTGMIISEVAEEYTMLGAAPLDRFQMAENMELFSRAFAESIDLRPLDMKKKVLSIYNGDDPVTQFNRKHIFVLGDRGEIINS